MEPGPHDPDRPGDLKIAARLRDPVSGRRLEVATTQPGLQVYTGDFLKGQKAKGGNTYPARCAVCLETQHFPDSVHQPGFPSIILRPGQTYRQRTAFFLSSEAPGRSPKSCPNWLAALR
ncbi:MAG: hypothetical protein U0793_24755 [Gemmataceae bacterium]